MLECAPHDSPDIIAEVIRRDGYEVAVCTGPDREHPCDLLEQVVAARRPAPLVMEVRPRNEAEFDGVPGVGAVKITKRVSKTDLLASIREALGRGSQRPPMWGDGCP